MYEVHVYTEIADDNEDQGIFTRKSVEKSMHPVYRLGKKGLILQKQDLPKAPKIVSQFHEAYRVKEDRELVLEVEADAIPEADFQWRQNNFEVSKNVTMERGCTEAFPTLDQRPWALA